MSWMIFYPKLLVNDLGQERRSPNAGIEAIGDWAALDYVVHAFQLSCSKARGPATAMALLEPVDGMVVPKAHPAMHGSTTDVE